MEEALISLLLGNGAVSAALGSRLWWGRAPQGVKVAETDAYGGPGPFGQLQRITGIHDYHMQGDSRYVESRVQIDIYGATYGSTKLAARTVIAALSGFRGTIGTTRIQGIFIDSERDLPATDAGEVAHLFRTSVDAIIHHSSS